MAVQVTIAPTGLDTLWILLEGVVDSPEEVMRVSALVDRAVPANCGPVTIQRSGTPAATPGLVRLEFRIFAQGRAAQGTLASMMLERAQAVLQEVVEEIKIEDDPQRLQAPEDTQERISAGQAQWSDAQEVGPPPAMPEPAVEGGNS